MTRPYSMDLRDRAIGRVVAGENARSVAQALSISAATVVRWSQRYCALGTVASCKIRGHKVGILARTHRDWLVERTQADFTLRDLVAEPATRGKRSTM